MSKCPQNRSCILYCQTLKISYATSPFISSFSIASRISNFFSSKLWHTWLWSLVSWHTSLHFWTYGPICLFHLECKNGPEYRTSKTIKIAARSARLSRHVTQDCTAYFQWRRKSFQNVNIHYNQCTNCISSRKSLVMIRDYIREDVQRWIKVFCTTNYFTESMYFL